MASLDLWSPQYAAARRNVRRRFEVSLSAELEADKEVGLAVVKSDGLAIIKLSAELRGDKEVGLAAVTQNAWAV